MERSASSHPLNSGKKEFAMLQAYMDDSGTHQGSPVTVIAGYFGGVRRWQEFERRWRKVLARENVPEFHAKQFWAKSGPYRGWSDKRGQRFLLDLIGIIMDSEIYPFASGVINEEWGKKTLAQRRYYTGATSKYPSGAPSRSMFLPFQRCVMQVGGHCKPGVRVNFVFDQNDQTMGWASLCYSELRRRDNHFDPNVASPLGDLTFADSKVATPLQAADMLAYEAFRYARAAKDDKNAPMRMTYALCLRRMKSQDDFWLFDAPRFASFERFAEEYKRSTDAKAK